MTSDKNKKITKLSKARIWPSVLFLIFSVCMAFFAFMALLVSTTSIIAMERLDAACSNALGIARMFNGSEGSEGSVLESIRRDTTFTDAVFIFDENGGFIDGFGAATFDRSAFELTETDKYSGDTYKMIYDTSLGGRNLFSETGELDLTPLLTQDSFNTITGAADSEKAVFEARFWIEKEISGGRTAMIKCSAKMRFRDFNSSLLSAIIALLLMMLPVLFFFVNVIISVTNQRRTTKLLYTDPTTGGNSFVYFEHTLNKLLNSRRNANKLYVIADVTIMKYRSFCNYHGIRDGEKLLEEADKKIATYLNKGEFCAHSGKSSFAVLLCCENKSIGEGRIKSMVRDLTEKSEHSGIVYHAGIYFCEPAADGVRDVTDPAACFNCASAARASLTDANVAAGAVYNDLLIEEERWEHRVEETMLQALMNDEFKVYIQPKYDPVTEKLVGGEALVRWINEEIGFVPPSRFIPIFEKNGFITRLDDHMLYNVARLQSEWIAAGKEVVPVSVNISRAHFANPNLALHISNIVDEFNVPHNLIEIELTESAFFDDKEALLKAVNDLSHRGFEISMDDFGAGYSSLNSLKDLPLDVLKLDAEFFRGDNAAERGEIVVSEAITLAKKLNMRIVAEGVEKKEQVDFLADQGCDMIQGYYFAKPMPADEYAQKLDSSGERPE